MEDVGTARTLADVSPSLAAALGVAGFEDSLGVGAARGVALLLVDGLGADLLDAHADRAPALAELAARGRTLVAGFPATTAVSVTTLGTGLPPGEHGIVGYSMGVPPLDDPAAPADVVLNTLRWCAHGAADPVDLRTELPPEQVQGAPTVLQRAARAGVAVTTVAPEIQRRSGLTRAALRGGRFRGVTALGDLGAEVLDALQTDAAEERTFVYAYHGDLDMVGHAHGPGSRPWRLQLAVVDRLVAAIAEDLPADTVLAVVADHGMVGTDAGWRVDVDTTPALLAGVRRLAGEARVRHVFAADGALDDVVAAWREELGEAAWVRTRDEAIAEGWFGGAVTDTARGRIGDVVAAARGNWTLVRSRIEPRETALVGHHGSLTDAEQRVPLLLCPAGS
ncbi:alkaline phosphatase family protein [Actinomycetospora lemnae]|uniref:Alkaline phosphatase family protein n=1 Tax=Actinomycetospora lemnae TaxID=3019891 RepID=A0ABT5SRY1_9PSEU|nr:nucleotide pyrophosphatase/phosphodiesterase family protein [Actinomycetospora sp. DW7H6]MDD7965607.1 alkaline phosphatase family protein [Actinomycetospora sp. DW7H6]